MNNKKQKIADMIKLNSNTTSEVFYNPGYQCDPYFGASSFYGEQMRVYQYHRTDGSSRERPYFIPSMYKALGRQLMN